MGPFTEHKALDLYAVTVYNLVMNNIEVVGWFAQDYPAQETKWSVVRREMGPKTVWLKTFGTKPEADAYAAVCRAEAK